MIATKSWVNDLLTKVLKKNNQNVNTSISSLSTSITNINNNLNKSYYSTTEKVVGTWINGKTLYEKTINFGTLANNTTKEVAHNIKNVDLIWMHEGFVIEGERSTGLTYVTTSSKNENNWSFQVNKTTIKNTTGMDRTDYTAYITLRYTKTS